MISIKMNVRIIYNQFTNEEIDKEYSIDDKVSEEYTLNEAITYIYDINNIVIDEELEKKKWWNLYSYIFNKIDFNRIICNEEELLNTKIGVLNSIFNIESQTLNIAYVYGIGDQVGESHGIKFFFHSNERDLHHRPHIHCRYSGEEIRVDLLTMKFMNRKSFKNNSKNKIVKKYVKDNRNSLIHYWNSFVNEGKKIEFEIEI